MHPLSNDQLLDICLLCTDRDKSLFLSTTKNFNVLKSKIFYYEPVYIAKY